MNKLKFPNKLIIKLVNSPEVLVDVENVVFYIKIYAFYKNDFYLGPFFTNAGGQCVITKNMFKIISDAVIETGIMDYRSIEEASALAEIQILKSEEIIKVIQDGGRAPKWQAKRL